MPERHLDGAFFVSASVSVFSVAQAAHTGLPGPAAYRAPGKPARGRPDETYARDLWRFL